MAVYPFHVFNLCIKFVNYIQFCDLGNRYILFCVAFTRSLAHEFSCRTMEIHIIVQFGIGLDGSEIVVAVRMQKYGKSRPTYTRTHTFDTQARVRGVSVPMIG